ncbi:MAG: hypothetical protein GSR72_02210 [Desulfurococcales archaeon]|nr:hypothetical protein [Desulfurococcales archaeon]MEB3788690.1 hypothetical protein [Desulfurococcales archaeon]
MISEAIPLVVKSYLQKKKLQNGEERTYAIYRIDLPKELAENTLGLKPGEEDMILAFFTQAKWYHLFNWSDPEVAEEILPRLTEKELTELCATLAPETICKGKKPHILVARPEDLKDLGLDPKRPITLEDLIEAVKEKLIREQATKPAMSPTT